MRIINRARITQFFEQLKWRAREFAYQFYILQPRCDKCGSPDCVPYYYEIWNEDSKTYLCLDCAAGLFCLYCRSFTAGTEDSFIYGKWQCSSCAGIQSEYEPEDDYYDEYGYAYDPYDD